MAETFDVGPLWKDGKKRSLYLCNQCIKEGRWEESYGEWFARMWEDPALMHLDWDYTHRGCEPHIYGYPIGKKMFNDMENNEYWREEKMTTQDIIEDTIIRLTQSIGGADVADMAFVSVNVGWLRAIISDLEEADRMLG